MSFQIEVVYWRDIPAQVKARLGRRRFSMLLSPRFQRAIDAAAMLAQATRSDSYLEGWHTRAEHPRVEDPQTAIEARVRSLEAEYSAKRLRSLIDNDGLAKVANDEL